MATPKPAMGGELSFGRRILVLRSANDIFLLAAVATGMTPMRVDGFEKVRDGITSIAELNSETHRNMLAMAAGA